MLGIDVAYRHAADRWAFVAMLAPLGAMMMLGTFFDYLFNRDEEAQSIDDSAGTLKSP